MKLFSNIKTDSHHPVASGFTLVEMMVVVLVFSFMVAAIVAVQIVALRVYTLGATKLSATTGARESLNAMRDQIRAAKLVYVGTYASGTGFTRPVPGVYQQGNAMEIGYTNSATTNYLIFYLDTTTATNTLYSISNNLSSTLNSLAIYVTNYYCFYAEDYRGNVLSNYLNNPVIHIVLQFDQWQYPLGFVGTNALNAYNFYNLTTRVMRRAKD
jgi:prepilin-type N-terminal cleavage/methylation domain-containing protein